MVVLWLESLSVEHEGVGSNPDWGEKKVVLWLFNYWSVIN